MGRSAGEYLTGSNWLVIDAYGDRGSIAGDTTGALIYGTSNATATSQRLYLNAPTQILGYVDASSAPAGYVGQVIESIVAPASAVSLTSGTAANVTSISLTAGDWEVSASVPFVTSAATMSVAEASISSTSATHTATGQEGFAGPIPTSSTTTSSAGVPARRITISATTTYYLVASATWSGTSCKAYGMIHARRVR